MGLFNIKKGGGGAKLYDLGTGTSFDLKTLVPDVDYTSLTADNFFYKDLTGAKSTWGGLKNGTNPKAYLNCGKSYNSSTGVLSVTLNANGGVAGGWFPEAGGAFENIDIYAYGSVHAYLILDYEIV